MAQQWIQGATRNKGGLHRSLGVPQGQTIPPGQIAAAAKRGGKVGAQARLAQTLEGLRPKSRQGRSQPDRNALARAAAGR